LKERNTVLEPGDQWKERYFQICVMKGCHLRTNSQNIMYISYNE